MIERQKPEFFDSHTHLQFTPYDADREAVILRAREAGVKMVLVGTQFKTSEAGVLLAEQNPNEMWAAVGFHPAHASDLGWHHDENEQPDAVREVFDAEALRSLARHPKVVAIGECGLDYFRLPSDPAQAAEEMEKQKDVFVAQIKLAQEIKKPPMIHCRAGNGRNAFQDVIGILKAYPYELKPGIIHFFTGTTEDAQVFLDLGFSFTFGGVVTFARNYDEVIKFIPIDRILSETDAPYVAPVPYRGKRNEPAYVVQVVERLAELKDVSLEQMATQVQENARRIFSL